jgi:serine/threonine-protein kinase
MDAPVKAGDIIDGRYQLERVIGTGGMAVVVAAIDIDVSERVAIKFLFKKAARHKEILQRFEREKAVIGRLEGEHVARMLGSGVVKNTPYMVMEYLQGRDLSDLLRVQKTLQVEQAAEYLLQACEAVAEAHGLDIVHRDLKPGNLFLTHRSDGSPCIKVLDFGIAKILGGGGDEGSLTRTEVVMGSPHYMSPEQMVSAKEVSAATDIWALGVILHELLAGKLPFAERTTEKLCARVLNGDPTPLRDDCPSCPEGLEQVVHRCLQRMPQDRFADVGELAAALAPFAPAHARTQVSRIKHRLRHRGEAPPEGEQLPSVAPPRNPEDAPEAPTVYLQKPSRIPWKQATFVAFGLAMAGLGFAGGVFFRGRPVEPPAAPVVVSAERVATVPTPAQSPPKPEPEEPLVPDMPIEIDLDDGVPRAEPAATRKDRERAPRATSSALPSGSVPPVGSAVVPPATATVWGTVEAPPVETAPTSTSPPTKPPTSSVPKPPVSPPVKPTVTPATPTATDPDSPY